MYKGTLTILSTKPTFFNAPIRLQSALHSRVWGGTALATRLSKKLPSSDPHGESWEIFWQNKIVEGVFAGQTLGQVIAVYPQEMLGTTMTGDVAADAEFPLLVKFLDSRDWLSVQVHPNDAHAKQLEGQPRGKTECWYVIDAQPDAQLIFGLNQALDANSYRAFIEAGKTSDVLQFVSVRSGDFIFVPAGTQHAIGPGLLIYELQQTSDTTYRIYDWDRLGLDGKPRPLHVEKALTVTTYEATPTAKVPYVQRQIALGVHEAGLTDGGYFGLKRWRLSPEASLPLRKRNEPMRPLLLTCVEGAFTLHGEASEEGSQTTSLALGESLFIPAALRNLTLQGTGDLLIAWPC
jgi:mannose-6-phosphate isomerase